MGQASSKPFHMKRWLSAQQAVDHLSAVAEEPLTSHDLARLAEDHHLDLYWYRPGQMLTYPNEPDKPKTELSQPLRLCTDNLSDWRAIVGILRNHPALPADENDSPMLRDVEGNQLRITFDFYSRPEPYSGLWYPSYSELMVKRSDIERLESRIFTEEDEIDSFEPRLLLDVIWQLETFAKDGSDSKTHDTIWLAEQLTSRASHLDRHTLERVLSAAERQHAH